MAFKEKNVYYVHTSTLYFFKVDYGKIKLCERLIQPLIDKKGGFT